MSLIVAKKIILARNATTSLKRLLCIQGRTDESIDSGGRLEAVCLARTLANIGIVKIIASSLSCARETAEIVARELGGIPVVVDERFVECSFGSFEGKSLEEAIAIDCEVARAIGRNFEYDFSKYGGESDEQVLSRHVDAIRDIIDCAEDVALVVGHTRGLNLLLKYFRKEPSLKRDQFVVLEL